MLLVMLIVRDACIPALAASSAAPTASKAEEA